MLKDTYLNQLIRYSGFPCRGGILGVVAFFVAWVACGSLAGFVGAYAVYYLYLGFVSLFTGGVFGWVTLAAIALGFVFGYKSVSKFFRRK